MGLCGTHDSRGRGGRGPSHEYLKGLRPFPARPRPLKVPLEVPLKAGARGIMPGWDAFRSSGRQRPGPRPSPAGGEPREPGRAGTPRAAPALAPRAAAREDGSTRGAPGDSSEMESPGGVTAPRRCRAACRQTVGFAGVGALTRSAVPDSRTAARGVGVADSERRVRAGVCGAGGGANGCGSRGLWGEGGRVAGCGEGAGCGRVRCKDDEVSSSVSVRFPRVYSSSRQCQQVQGSVQRGGGRARRCAS